jgi:hypothetical protein
LIDEESNSTDKLSKAFFTFGCLFQSRVLKDLNKFLTFKISDMENLTIKKLVKITKFN